MQRRKFSVRVIPVRQLVAPTGSHRNNRGGDESLEALGVAGRERRLGDRADRNARERRGGLEKRNATADPPRARECRPAG